VVALDLLEAAHVRPIERENRNKILSGPRDACTFGCLLLEHVMLTVLAPHSK
jgi:hypothetical protein